MIQRLLAGVVLALCAAGVLVISGGSDLEHVTLLGAALGGVLGLIPNSSPLGKLGGFGTGFIVAWTAFGVRALLLPDTPAGRAVAAFLVILVCGVVAAFSAGKIPLWSSLLGVAAMVGAFEAADTLSLSQLLTTAPQAATTVLLTAGFGFFGVALANRVARAGDAQLARGRHRVPTEGSATHENDNESLEKDRELLEKIMAIASR